MGYYITQGDTEILIKGVNHTSLIKKVKEFIKAGNEFDWANNDVILKTFSITELFDEICWEVKFNEQGDIDTLGFIGEKLGSEDVFFDLIAEFVEDGSYITIYGECADSWKYVFHNGKMKILQGKMIYE